MPIMISLIRIIYLGWLEWHYNMVFLNPHKARGWNYPPPLRLLYSLELSTFQWLSIKYCFVHFFSKKNKITASPVGHGGLFLNCPQPKFANFERFYHKTVKSEWNFNTGCPHNHLTQGSPGYYSAYFPSFPG